LVYEYGDFSGVLYPFVEGIPPGPSDQTCYEIGRGLATLHKVYIKEGLRPHEEVGFGVAEIVNFVASNECPDDFKEAFNNIFPDSLEDFRENLWETGLIHGDLYYDNTLFDNNKLAYLLDFEQAGIGPFILDIGISMSGTCLEKGRVLPELVASYLEGYESVRPLQGQEIEHLTDSILIGLFSIALWRIKRFKIGKLNPEMADSYKDLLYKAFLFHHRIQKS
jgi:homoserine kinase type II